MCPVMERAIREKLLAKVPGLSHAKRQQISNALFEIRQEAEQFSRAGSESIETAEESWEKMLEIPVIRVGLWGAERICFSALFHAYENFVRHVFGLITHNDPGYRIKDLKAFPSDFEKAFGAELAQTCLNDVEVRNARIVRNAVAHNGGRNTDELRKVQHDFPIHDDQIQITTQHTRTLHQSLKERSLRLAEAGKETLGKRVS